MLIERRVEFANGYRMRCEICRASNWLTTEEYARSTESMMTCAGCGGDFHFGPAVIDLKDADDLALDDSRLTQLAWYHTTTDAEWPRHSKKLSAAELQTLRQWGRSEHQIESYRQRHENLAIHVGTYESAIESMLRRMRNQGDQESNFYLHRVCLRHDLVMEPGWRDENSAEAAKVSSADLVNRGVDGIRYLNAYESIGSLSLAVVRGAIKSTQRVVVPVPQLIQQPVDATVGRLRALRDEVHAVVAEHADDPLTALARLRRQASSRSAGRIAVTSPEAWSAVAELETFAARQYLVGLSPVIREIFLRSLHRPLPEGDHDMDLIWLRRFMGLAALLTRSDEVHGVLDRQPCQTVMPA